MTTWVLVFLLYPGTNAGMALTVPNIPTYQECVRIQMEIMAMRPDRLDAANSKCIEVKK